MLDLELEKVVEEGEERRGLEEDVLAQRVSEGSLRVCCGLWIRGRAGAAGARVPGVLVAFFFL